MIKKPISKNIICLLGKLAALWSTMYRDTSGICIRGVIKIESPVLPKRFTQSVLIVLISGLSIACGGESSDSSSKSNNARASQETPILGAPNPDSSSSVPTDDTAPSLSEEDSEGIEAISQEIYYRPADYPEMVTYPLQYITTKGGKQLAVRITVPATEKGVPASGQFPAVLVQSAYNPNQMALFMSGMPGGILLGTPDPFVVKRGYVEVTVDALGTGLSEGGWELFGADEQNAYGDAIDWILQQPWSNGKIGTAGVSYMANSAIFSAQQRPDAIQAVFASLAMGDAMRGTVGTGGMFNGLFLSEWMMRTQSDSVQNVPMALLNPNLMTQIMQITQEHIDQIDRYYLPLIEAGLNGAPEYTYSSEFWRVRSPIENIDKVKAPTFIFGALHDIFQRDEPLLYERLKKIMLTAD